MADKSAHIFIRSSSRLMVYVLAGIVGFVTMLMPELHAQTKGTITGRVVTDDGYGQANVTVRIRPSGNHQVNITRSTTTDEEGAFRFANLFPSSYSIAVSNLRGYVLKSSLTLEQQKPYYYNVGDNITISIVKGGVITGRVISPDGDPVIGVKVDAIRVRDSEDHLLPNQISGYSQITDDRGIYRLYGLPAGRYLVVANFDASFSPKLSRYTGETSTYFPSATRDTAAEVHVTSGGEATGIDIRHLGNFGYAVSGTVTGNKSKPLLIPSFISIYLYGSTSKEVSGTTSIRLSESNNTFAIYGIPDGEYDLIAIQDGNDGGTGFLSRPRRVMIRGSSVTGVELELVPMASIAGVVSVKNTPSLCEGNYIVEMEEFAITARRDGKRAGEYLAPFLPPASKTIPNQRGEFAIRGLSPNHYQIEVHFRGENWYVKSMTGSTAAASTNRGSILAAKTESRNDINRTGFTLKEGDNLTGLTITIADDAASLRGRIMAEKGGTSLPSSLRVHLVPSVPSLANDVLRYAEAQVQSDGTFTFNNLAPGQYWIITYISPDAEGDRVYLPIAWDDNERAKLRNKAEAMKIEIKLTPCQKLKNIILKY